MRQLRCNPSHRHPVRCVMVSLTAPARRDAASASGATNPPRYPGTGRRHRLASPRGRQPGSAFALDPGPVGRIVVGAGGAPVSSPRRVSDPDPANRRGAGEGGAVAASLRRNLEPDPVGRARPARSLGSCPKSNSFQAATQPHAAPPPKNKEQKQPELWALVGNCPARPGALDDLATGAGQFSKPLVGNRSASGGFPKGGGQVVVGHPEFLVQSASRWPSTSCPRPCQRRQCPQLSRAQSLYPKKKSAARTFCLTDLSGEPRARRSPPPTAPRAPRNTPYLGAINGRPRRDLPEASIWPCKGPLKAAITRVV